MIGFLLLDGCFDAFQDRALEQFWRIALKEENHAAHLSHGIAELGFFRPNQIGNGIDDRIRGFCFVDAFLRLRLLLFYGTRCTKRIQM
jgi:hypothetical protein